MKMLWKLSREAVRCKELYLLAILATLSLTFVNLAAPEGSFSHDCIVETGVTENGLLQIRNLIVILICLYLSRIVFRFMSSYMAHKSASGNA